MKEFLLFDIEANGFKPNTIYVISILDLISREVVSYHGLDNIAIGIQRLLDAQMLVGHYIKGYDIPVIELLSGAKFNKDVLVDTLELSRTYCDLKKHGLGYWGDMIGLPKLPKPDFDKFDEILITYCERDVRVNEMMFDIILEIIIEQNTIPEKFKLVESYFSAIG